MLVLKSSLVSLVLWSCSVGFLNLQIPPTRTVNPEAMPTFFQKNGRRARHAAGVIVKLTGLEYLLGSKLVSFFMFNWVPVCWSCPTKVVVANLHCSSLHVDVVCCVRLPRYVTLLNIRFSSLNFYS